MLILHSNQCSWDVPAHTKMENYSLLINMSYMENRWCCTNCESSGLQYCLHIMVTEITSVSKYMLKISFLYTGKQQTPNKQHMPVYHRQWSWLLCSPALKVALCTLYTVLAQLFTKLLIQPGILHGYSECKKQGLLTSVNVYNKFTACLWHIVWYFHMLQSWVKNSNFWVKIICYWSTSISF